MMSSAAQAGQAMTPEAPLPPPAGVVGSSPAFSDVSFDLRKGQAVCAGSGSLAWMRGDVVMTNSSMGGIVSGVRRLLAGEDMVINTFEGGDAGGSVCFAGIVPGDVVEILVRAGEVWTLTRGGALCWDPWVSVTSKFSARGIIPLGTEEGFVLPTATVDGGKDGRLWVSAFGGFETHVLSPGERLFVDNGMFLASTMEWETQNPAGGVFQSWYSGEGFGMGFTGDGKGVVYTQNRNFNHFCAIVAPSELTATEAALTGAAALLGPGEGEGAGGAGTPPQGDDGGDDDGDGGGGDDGGDGGGAELPLPDPEDFL